MSIKADRWIRRMALEHGMIEPFVDGQVRQGVISYGLTSYGYDMRVTDQFKVFTNVYNVLVDPKHFDPRSFVDIRAEHIDIPPNSFALAQSLEYFRIPRMVSCIVIGKSTYARCFHGDTRVALIDGSAPTLEQMARRADTGERFWGYSIGQDGRIIVTLLEAPRYIGRDQLLELVLDNGQSIHCTPDHKLMLRNGQWRAASDLRPDDSLMPLYRDLCYGAEVVYQPLSGCLDPTQRLVDEWMLHNDSYKETFYTDPAAFKGFPMELHAFHGVKFRNHKITAIASLPGEHDVYCLTVPEAGNFALESGVFVQNCGIIINVTPLEPEWQGHVTIEISNTTPLPARIYANEGIGQVLFMESDEECERSYADKRGKYQGQTGIVLPRIDETVRG